MDGTGTADVADVADIERVVRELKTERDTLHAVALQYKAAFDMQTCRLRELQDLCVAAQAELENERARPRHEQRLPEETCTCNDALAQEVFMLHRQAREASVILSSSGTRSTGAQPSLSRTGNKLRLPKRRSGFEEHRTLSEDWLGDLMQQSDSKRRRSSAQLRHRAAAKAKEWMLLRSEGPCG
ncbi:hypothetical protein ACN47E_001348 [Coniothyrium glycines]